MVLESKNDPGKALVFFHGEDMIRDQEPVVVPVADVIRVSDTQVKVGDTTYTLEGERLTVDNPSQGQTLSIATPPPAREAITRYYGNVNGKPWGQELKPSGMYTYPIGEHNLLGATRMRAGSCANAATSRTSTRWSRMASSMTSQPMSR